MSDQERKRISETPEPRDGWCSRRTCDVAITGEALFLAAGILLVVDDDEEEEGMLDAPPKFAPEGPADSASAGAANAGAFSR